MKSILDDPCSLSPGQFRHIRSLPECRDGVKVEIGQKMGWEGDMKEAHIRRLLEPTAGDSRRGSFLPHSSPPFSVAAGSLGYVLDLI